MYKRTLLILLGVAFGMFILAFSSVFLYRVFCDVTGYGGTTRKGTLLDGLNDNMISGEMLLRLDANISKKLPWQFFPEKQIIKISVGEQPQKLFYVAINMTDHQTSGKATYNVTPHSAAPYFYKIDCFCFTEQHLRPHEKKMMPVIFYIDPAIKDDPHMRLINHITLSYTFFPLDDLSIPEHYH